MKHPNPLALLRQQFRIEWRLYVRDRGAMFWTFLFPLLMLFGMGMIFRSGGAPSVTLVRVAPAQETARDAAFLKALDEAHLKVLTLDAAAAEARWRKGDTSAQLESVGDGYRLRLNSYLIAQGNLAAQAASQAFMVAQARLAGSPEPERIPMVMESPRCRRNSSACFRRSRPSVRRSRSRIRELEANSGCSANIWALPNTTAFSSLERSNSPSPSAMKMFSSSRPSSVPLASRRRSGRVPRISLSVSPESRSFRI